MEGNVFSKTVFLERNVYLNGNVFLEENEFWRKAYIGGEERIYEGNVFLKRKLVLEGNERIGLTYKCAAKNTLPKSVFPCSFNTQQFIRSLKN